MNDMKSIKQQIDDVLAKYPNWNVIENEESYILTGDYILNSSYNEVSLYDEYRLEITISKSFPKIIPKVKELTTNLPEGFNHYLGGGNLCLGAMCDIYDFLDEHHEIQEFIDGLIVSYLYTASFYKRYRYVPYGERAHGLYGVIEAYLERYDVGKDLYLLYKLLLIMSGRHEYRGHMSCPCGSDKKIRNCHGKVLLKDISSDRYEYYKAEADQIVNAFEEIIREESRKNDNSTTKKCFR